MGSTSRLLYTYAVAPGCGVMFFGGVFERPWRISEKISGFFACNPGSIERKAIPEKDLRLPCGLIIV